MDGGDERGILRCLESSGGKEGSFYISSQHRYIEKAVMNINVDRWQ